MSLTDTDRETVLAYAASNMSIKATAEKIYLSRNTVIYRLDKIKQKTGLDPRRFYDLVKLVAMASADMPEERTTEREWIRVEDRLPEMAEHYQSNDVLVCISYRPDDPVEEVDRYVSIDHVDFNCFGQGEFSCERDDPRDGEPSPYFVTHWMPLPELPEVGI